LGFRSVYICTMIQIKYKNWDVIYSGDQLPNNLIDDVIGLKNLNIIKQLKNNQRSRVLLIEILGKKHILKIPKEKNRRKWIRFTTLYRKGESFRALLAMEKLNKKGVKTNTPVLAIERKVFGMVVDSRYVFEYLEGEVCTKAQYEGIVNKLDQMHANNLLHGDPLIDNFLFDGKEVLIIDAIAREPLFGKISKAVELLYLAHSANGIDRYFGSIKNSFPYKVAKRYNDLYWRWRDIKKKVRRKK